MLSVIVSGGDERAAIELMMKETSTLGVRVRSISRYEAGREVKTVETSLGAARVKVKSVGGSALSASPEIRGLPPVGYGDGLAAPERLPHRPARGGGAYPGVANLR